MINKMINIKDNINQINTRNKSHKKAKVSPSPTPTLTPISKKRNYGCNRTKIKNKIRGTTKKGDDSANQEMENRMKRMKEERDADIQKLTGNRPPMSY